MQHSNKDVKTIGSFAFGQRLFEDVKDPLAFLRQWLMCREETWGYLEDLPLLDPSFPPAKLSDSVIRLA